MIILFTTGLILCILITGLSVMATTTGLRLLLQDIAGGIAFCILMLMVLMGVYVSSPAAIPLHSEQIYAARQ